MRGLAFLVGVALATGVYAQQIEKRDVHIAVGGKSALYYLPLVLTERLNYFKDEGLNVRISDFAGGTRSLEAVVGGSADVVAGAYEHTINMQSRRQNFQAFVLMGAAPQISVGISSKLADKYKSPKDLKGLKVGISAPGSSTNMVINYLLAQGGLKPTDVAIIGVGQGATVIAAMDQGKVDAEVLYPSPRIQNALILNRDPEWQIACVRAYNDWLSEFCAYDPARFVDAETGESLALDPAATALAYRTAYRAHGTALVEAVRGHGFDHLPLRTDHPPLEAPRAHLARRAR